MFSFFSWLSADMGIGIGVGCVLWAGADFLYRWFAKGGSTGLAFAAVKADAKGVEQKVVEALAQGTRQAITTVRHEAAVKLSAVEAALHDRLVSVEKSVFGATYSPDTIALAAKAAAQKVADVAAKAVATQARLTEHPALLPTSPASAAAVASTAIASLATLAK